MKEKVDVLISEKEIDNRILEIADRINKDYEGEELTLICVLKGGVMFMCATAIFTFEISIPSVLLISVAILSKASYLAFLPASSSLIFNIAAIFGIL